MRRFLMLTAVAMISYGAAQSAFADQRPDGPPPACHAQDKKCPERPKDQTRRGDPRQDDRRAETAARRHADLRPGDSGKSGKPFRPARDSRLQAAPRGQEYRVIRDQLVLVESQSKKIVRVIGPATERGR